MNRYARLLRLLITTALIMMFPALGTAATENTQRSESAGAQSSLTLDFVLESISNIRAAEVPFQETQTNPMLETPIVSLGVLEYDAVDRSLLKRTHTPEITSYLMSETEVVLSRDGKTRRFSMKRSAELQAIFTSIRGVIEGSREDIEAFFDTSFFAEGNVWNIELLPRDKKLKERLEIIEIWGIADQVDTIITRSPNGATQTMRLNIDSTSGPASDQ